MEKTNSNKRHRIDFGFTTEEYTKLELKWLATTCKNRTDYIRKHLLQEPITINHRDQSIDEYMSEIIRLRGELNALCINFNQTVKKLDSLQHIPECIVWLISAKLEKEQLLNKVEEIKNHIQKMSEKWLQS